MTTCREIVTYALRQGKVLAPGDTPTDDEINDGMAALQSLYDGWVAGATFGRLTDVYKDAAYTAKERERVTSPSDVTIAFPDTVEDAQNGGQRAPRDLSLIETITGGVRVVKIWDRTSWVSLLDLTLDTAAPLSNRGAWALAAVLATSGGFLGIFGAEPARDVRMLALGFMASLSAKTGTTQDRIPAEYC